MDTEKIIENCKKNLDRGRTPATGIGVFVCVQEGENFLMRLRTEKDSITGQDLSGNWELIGGGVELQDFDGRDYQSAIFNALKRELMEEAGIKLLFLDPTLLLIPAWHGKNGLIDLAFVVKASWNNVKETPKFHELLAEGKIKFFTSREITDLNIISPRMRFMAIEQAHFC